MALTINQKLVILCLILTLPVLFVSNRIKNESVYIGPLELAEKIKSREPIRLIDLRSTEEYNEFHLPGAENMEPGDFLSIPDIDEYRVVFYAGDDSLAADLWKQLPGDIRRKTNILYGGAGDWFDRLLYPKIPLDTSTEDSLLVEQIKGLSKFYGGQPEFVKDPDVLEYYHKDIQDDKHKTPSSGHKLLKRRGC